nr:hypothetical protein [Polymorphobacter sp.]
MKLSTSINFAIVAAAAIGASPALALTSVTPPQFLNSSSYAEQTPSMQRHKLQQAIALRTEVAQLQAADGGTLSAEHRAYARKRAAIIRDGQLTPQIGSLIARR